VPRQPPEQDSNRVETRSQVTDADLLGLVNEFASRSSNSDTAWNRLRAYSRPELVASLLRIQQSLTPDDRQRVLISFTFCNLGFEYERNREIVVSALTRKPHYREFYADWAADLLTRLMEHGDERVLPSLLSAAPWSDGEAATTLGAAYVEKWRSDPKGLLVALRSVSKGSRESVYLLLLADEFMTDPEVDKMQVYLRSLRGDSSTGLIVREMLAAIPRVELQIKQNR